MFVKFENVIINLNHVVDISAKKEVIEIYMVNGKKYTIGIINADALEKVLAEYNETRGYEYD